VLCRNNNGGYTASEDDFAGLDVTKDNRLKEFNRPSFSQAEVISATHLSEKTLQNYLARYEEALGLSATAPGKGQRRLYSTSDAIFLAAMTAISGFGLAPLRAAHFANHVRAWAQIEARRYYEGGFIHLPDQLFGVSAPFEGNESDLMIQASTFEEINAWAKEYGHHAILILDGKRIAQETARELWARYQLTSIDNHEDWEKARFKPAEE
jgi:hypothetical protein